MMLIKITKIVVYILLAVAVILFIIHEAMPQTHGVDYIVNSLRVAGQAEGTIEFRDSSATVTLDEDEWDHVTNDENDLFTLKTGSQNMTLTGDSLIIYKNGVYHGWFRLSLELGANKDMKLGIAKNSSDVIYGKIRFNSESVNKEITGCTEILITDAPDTLWLTLYNITDGTDATVYNGGITLSKVR